MIKNIIGYCVLLVLVSNSLFAQTESYGIADQPWDEGLGNHRAVLRVGAPGNVARVVVNWRRRDEDLLRKRIILLDEQGRQIRNIFPVTINQEKAEILFQPQSGAGNYYLYYMPYQGKKNVGWWQGAYLKAENTASEEWLMLLNKQQGGSSVSSYPIATVEKLESRTAFDSFYPMEVCATKEERNNLKQKHAGPMLLFPEDRKYPIRMTKDLPAKWMVTGPQKVFNGQAHRNEYYVFQIGVLATDTLLSNVQVKSSLPGFTCFNTGGVDARGKDFIKRVDIPKGEVQAMWIGIDIPENPTANRLEFSITIQADQASPQEIAVSIDVDKQLLADRGDSEPWRHSRLRWLNSRLGLNDDVVKPYSALKLSGKTIKAKTAQLQLNDLGLPETIIAGVTKINDTLLQFEIETAEGIEKLKADPLQFVKKSPGNIGWKLNAANEKLKLLLEGFMEFDGTIQYSLKLTAKQKLDIKDIRLVLAVREEASRYFMGMGLPGGACPDTYDWKWKGPTDAFWIGDVTAGLHVELQGATYSGPLLNLYKPAPPPSW